MGIEGEGSLMSYLAKIAGTLMRIPTLNLDVRVFIAQKPGK